MSMILEGFHPDLKAHSNYFERGLKRMARIIADKKLSKVNFSTRKILV